MARVWLPIWLEQPPTKVDSSGQFRARGGLLGDIIHSSPVFVGAPNPGLYPDGIEGGGVNSYYQWANVDAANRIPMVYVGANDGMLHGFRAEDGEEVFGYFPQQLFSSATGKGLHWLAEQGYSHRYYVDMTPTVADVFIDTGDGAGASWHTILVGGCAVVAVAFSPWMSPIPVSSLLLPALQRMCFGSSPMMIWAIPTANRPSSRPTAPLWMG
ncbi:type 4 fimbrial biogenesis protein PilY1 [endosymbiont of Riftia pachyptila (vent Ph05)]|uniref:Type 4 fimbrial biogenesis protein PilY1 n=1 Tax=endosymbiont of Riftia pachyptila (vent Ph05) TaxID=1048808 RepID=G2DAY1_9GAMM|nr:type 4 fimbrial biogenesis protein PilY1 [endosymbiont of Riftia pachyptila (vent Ph05)]